MNEKAFEKCIKMMCQGKQEGLKRIYEAYLPYIFSIISGILSNREDAEDVTSEFFIRLWNTAEKYRPGNGHKAYLATIARNMAIDFLRKRKREIATDLSGGNEEENNAVYQGRDDAAKAGAPPGGEYDEGFEDDLVESLTLQEALKTLNSSEREIINLKIMGDLTFKEIAEILDTPMGTVTWRYREAIKKLRRYGYE